MNAADMIRAIEEVQARCPVHVDIRDELGIEPPEDTRTPRDPDGLLDENRAWRQLP